MRNHVLFGRMIEQRGFMKLMRVRQTHSGFTGELSKIPFGGEVAIISNLIISQRLLPPRQIDTKNVKKGFDPRVHAHSVQTIKQCGPKAIPRKGNHQTNALGGKS